MQAHQMGVRQWVSLTELTDLVFEPDAVRIHLPVS